MRTLKLTLGSWTISLACLLALTSIQSLALDTKRDGELQIESPLEGNSAGPAQRAIARKSNSDTPSTARLINYRHMSLADSHKGGALSSSARSMGRLLPGKRKSKARASAARAMGQKTGSKAPSSKRRFLRLKREPTSECKCEQQQQQQTQVLAPAVEDRVEPPKIFSAHDHTNQQETHPAQQQLSQQQLSQQQLSQQQPSPQHLSPQHLSPKHLSPQHLSPQLPLPPPHPKSQWGLKARPKKKFIPEFGPSYMKSPYREDLKRQRKLEKLRAAIERKKKQKALGGLQFLENVSVKKEKEKSNEEEQIVDWNVGNQQTKPSKQPAQDQVSNQGRSDGGTPPLVDVKQSTTKPDNLPSTSSQTLVDEVALPAPQNPSPQDNQEASSKVSSSSSSARAATAAPNVFVTDLSASNTDQETKSSAVSTTQNVSNQVEPATTKEVADLGTALAEQSLPVEKPSNLTKRDYIPTDEDEEENHVEASQARQLNIGDDLDGLVKSESDAGNQIVPAPNNDLNNLGRSAGPESSTQSDAQASPGASKLEPKVEANSIQITSPVSTNSERTGNPLNSVVKKVEEKVEGLKEKVEDKIEGVKEKVEDIKEVKEKVKNPEPIVVDLDPVAYSNYDDQTPYVEPFDIFGHPSQTLLSNSPFLDAPNSSGPKAEVDRLADIGNKAAKFTNKKAIVYGAGSGTAFLDSETGYSHVLPDESSLFDQTGSDGSSPQFSSQEQLAQSIAEAGFSGLDKFSAPPVKETGKIVGKLDEDTSINQNEPKSSKHTIGDLVHDKLDKKLEATEQSKVSALPVVVPAVKAGEPYAIYKPPFNHRNRGGNKNFPVHCKHKLNKLKSLLIKLQKIVRKLATGLLADKKISHLMRKSLLGDLALIKRVARRAKYGTNYGDLEPLIARVQIIEIELTRIAEHAVCLKLEPTLKIFIQTLRSARVDLRNSCGPQLLY